MEAVVERVGMMVSDGLSFHHDRSRLPHAPPAAPRRPGEELERDERRPL